MRLWTNTPPKLAAPFSSFSCPMAGASNLHQWEIWRRHSVGAELSDFVEWRTCFFSHAFQYVHLHWLTCIGIGWYRCINQQSYSYLFMAMAVDQQLYPLKHQSVSPAFKASHVLGLWHWIHVLHLLGESLQAMRISGCSPEAFGDQPGVVAPWQYWSTQKDIWTPQFRVMWHRKVCNIL